MIHCCSLPLCPRYLRDSPLLHLATGLLLRCIATPLRGAMALQTAFDVMQYWHARSDKEPANRWLRSLLVELFQER